MRLAKEGRRKIWPAAMVVGLTGEGRREIWQAPAPLLLALACFFPSSRRHPSPLYLLPPPPERLHGRSLLSSSPPPPTTYQPDSAARRTSASSASSTRDELERERLQRRRHPRLPLRLDTFSGGNRRPQTTSSSNDSSILLPVSSPSDSTSLPSVSSVGRRRSLLPRTLPPLSPWKSSCSPCYAAAPVAPHEQASNAKNPARPAAPPVSRTPPGTAACCRSASPARFLSEV